MTKTSRQYQRLEELGKEADSPPAESVWPLGDGRPAYRQILSPLFLSLLVP